VVGQKAGIESWARRAAALKEAPEAGVPATPAFWTPPPGGVVAQRRLFSTVMMGDERGRDRAEQASDGLPADFDDAP